MKYRDTTNEGKESEYIRRGEVLEQLCKGGVVVVMVVVRVGETVTDSRSITLWLVDSDNTIILEDIAFGDVILCSGQSNMELTSVSSAEQHERAQPSNIPADFARHGVLCVSVSGANKAPAKIADSVNYISESPHVHAQQDGIVDAEHGRHVKDWRFKLSL
jgi:hypothetical protein